MGFLLDVHIRPYEANDAAALWEAAQESVVALQPWMPWCHPAYSLDDARSWLELQVAAYEQRTAFEFAIVSTQAEYLGGCGLSQIDQVNQRADLWYWVRTPACHRGVATNAVRLIRDWAFQHTDLVRLEIVIAVGNVASHRVAEKCPANREGVLKHRLLLRGVPHDATMFSLTRETER
jgi:ribosomal-protein-serine acetyltransferase